jgi:CrcB-like protein
LIGVIIAETQKNGMSENKLLFLKFGLCGGLTTFSTFSVEMYGYLEKGNVVIAIGYAVVSVALSIIGLMLGMKMV